MRRLNSGKGQQLSFSLPSAVQDLYTYLSITDTKEYVFNHAYRKRIRVDKLSVKKVNILHIKLKLGMLESRKKGKGNL